ncbi:MAG: hypothetical protein E7137_04245 [Rikenellaceae bacterium]|nr:hypothetical protein [Rikenellaceae bacterium]
MADNRILKLVDSSYKECEVTGRDMGGDDLYEIPVANLKLGYIDWAQSKRPNHNVNVIEIGEDYITLSITNVSRSVNGPYTLRVGEKKSYSYYFGEWSYGYTISVEEGDKER